MGELDVAQIANDVHSRLNATRVLEIIRPARIDEVREAILRVKQEGPRNGGLAICGGRHAMGLAAHRIKRLSPFGVQCLPDVYGFVYAKHEPGLDHHEFACADQPDPQTVLGVDVGFSLGHGPFIGVDFGIAYDNPDAERVFLSRVVRGRESP